MHVGIPRAMVIRLWGIIISQCVRLELSRKINGNSAVKVLFLRPNDYKSPPCSRTSVGSSSKALNPRLLSSMLALNSALDKCLRK